MSPVLGIVKVTGGATFRTLMNEDQLFASILRPEVIPLLDRDAMRLAFLSTGKRLSPNDKQTKLLCKTTIL